MRGGTLIDRWLGSRRSLISLWAGDHGGYHIILATADKDFAWLAKDTFVTGADVAMARIVYLMETLPESWEKVK